MPQIQVLSDLLVNKIAAGEVIERPASVVKELVENSLDAGATRVEIAIEDGGRRLIRVTDDGAGMDRDDLALCIQPHATSKLRHEDDLFRIRTMGFRGEALPSIGAVSYLRVVSRRPDSDAAHEIRVTGEHIAPLIAASGPPGTTVEVRDLFFNVPARQKFLRSAPTEIGHITEQVARIALVQPGVEFRLLHNNRVVHHLRATGTASPVAGEIPSGRRAGQDGMRQRIADFYGQELADALLEIHRNERGLKISGYVSSPVDSRSSAKYQYLFLNGRFIRDRFIAAAVREAYRGLMEPHRHPVLFLSFEIDPAAIDVNVHPTKIEVRWQDSNVLYSQVLSALRDRFLSADLTPALQTDESFNRAAMLPQVDFENTDRPEPPPAQAGSGVPGAAFARESADESAAEQRRREIRASIADYFKRARPIVGSSAPPAYGPPVSDAATLHPGGAAADPTAFDSEPRTQNSEPTTPRPEPRPESARLATPIVAEDALIARQAAFSLPDHVLQVHRTYLVAETADGLIIIDQHALHERIIYEQLSERIAAGSLESQRLLIPDLIEVSPDHVGLIETHEQTLARLGFELTPYDPRTIAVHAAPSLLAADRVRDFLKDLIDRLAMRSAPASAELLMNDILSMMACKAAVKAGDELTDAEIQALMRERHRVERSSNCPHGRPTSLRLTLRDLERQFKRA